MQPERRWLHLTQLSQQLGIAKGSISPLLHTLQDREYLTLDEQDHHYRIGRMAFRIGNTYLDEASACERSTA